MSPEGREETEGWGEEKVPQTAGRGEKGQAERAWEWQVDYVWSTWTLTAPEGRPIALPAHRNSGDHCLEEGSDFGCQLS